MAESMGAWDAKWSGGLSNQQFWADAFANPDKIRGNDGVKNRIARRVPLIQAAIQSAHPTWTPEQRADYIKQNAQFFVTGTTPGGALDFTNDGELNTAIANTVSAIDGGNQKLVVYRAGRGTNGQTHAVDYLGKTYDLDNGDVAAPNGRTAFAQALALKGKTIDQVVNRVDFSGAGSNDLDGTIYDSIAPQVTQAKARVDAVKAKLVAQGIPQADVNSMIDPSTGRFVSPSLQGLGTGQANKAGYESMAADSESSPSIFSVDPGNVVTLDNYVSSMKKLWGKYTTGGAANTAQEESKSMGSGYDAYSKSLREARVNQLSYMNTAQTGNNTAVSQRRISWRTR